MENIDKKIEQTLSSLDGIKQTEMPVDLQKKIKRAIDNQRNKPTRIVPFRFVLLVAAMFCGIVFLNVVSLISSNQPTNTKPNKSVQAFATAYFSDSSLNY